MTERENSEPNTQALDHQSHNHPAIGKLRDKRGPDRRRRLAGTVAKQVKARQMALSASPEARNGSGSDDIASRHRRPEDAHELAS